MTQVQGAGEVTLGLMDPLVGKRGGQLIWKPMSCMTLVDSDALLDSFGRLCLDGRVDFCSFPVNLDVPTAAASQSSFLLKTIRAY